MLSAWRGVFLWSDGMESVAIKVADVVFRDDLYPRIDHSATTVQKYAEDLDVLPPIEVNQNNELIDGWHRWTAHRKQEADEIKAIVTTTTSEAEFLELAIERNSAHGLQLSQTDKKDMARKIYNQTAESERDEKKKTLAKILSVSERTIREWLSRIDKDSKEARKKRIFELWLAGNTEKEIGELVGLTQQAVSQQTADSPNVVNLNKTDQAAAEHATDFSIPVYNIWKQQTKSEGSNHFGNSESTWLDNLLYMYTDPFDTVVDPFAGGGSTIDVCKKRFRRYFVSDRKPIVEREKEIRQHDLTDGILKPSQWNDVKLVYLDPPYWIQAAGEYSDDPTDLANMTLDEFTTQLAKIVKQYAAKLSDAYIALIIQPTQWKAPERQFTDHIGDMLRMVKLPVDMRFSVPYESQQCNAQMVEWAKENKRCLVLSREIIVWSVK
jgi:ParB-like chromosome segregation protein Spo0J